jgi:hypothetical protein
VIKQKIRYLLREELKIAWGVFNSSQARAAQELGKESVEKAFTSIQRLPSYLNRYLKGLVIRQLLPSLVLVVLLTQ